MSRDWPIVVGGTRRPGSLPGRHAPIILHELKHPVRASAGLLRQMRWSVVDCLLVIGEVAAAGLVVLLAYLAVTLPDPTSLDKYLGAADSGHATIIGDSEPVRLDQVPQSLRQTIIKVEGNGFFGSTKFDLIRVVEALSGLSTAAEANATIAERLAASMLPQRRLDEGDILRRWMLALRLESHFTQSQLLEIYLNRTSFGDGVFGVDAAAHRYFGKEVRALNAQQSVQLAVKVDLPLPPISHP